MTSPLRIGHERLAPLRYLAVGALVACTYLGLTLLLSTVAGVAIWLAIAIGYIVAVALHFFLQRHFVFAHVGEFALPVRVQIRRYVYIGASQYAITTATTAILPERLGVSEQVVYVVTAVGLTVIGFALLRGRVFHPGEDHTELTAPEGGA